MIRDKRLVCLGDSARSPDKGGTESRKTRGRACAMSKKQVAGSDSRKVHCFSIKNKECAQSVAGFKAAAETCLIWPRKK